VALYCLASGAVVPYARAKAEGLGMRADVGIAERADRLVLILVTTGFAGIGTPYVLEAALWILAVASTVTVVQRMALVRRQSLALTLTPAPGPATPPSVPARDRLAYALFAAGWAVVRRLPERWAYALFRGVADLLWRRRVSGVRQLERNLRGSRRSSTRLGCGS
jgi:CDP-diacylglycerol--glycerol-3-phosphate 3-phosphatidyltransferase